MTSTETGGTGSTPSDVVGARVKQIRDRSGLRAVDVARACAEIGMPQLTANTLSNIETGRRDENGMRRRDVTVDELMALACALQVSPLVLLLPAERTQYPVTTTVSADAERVYRWFVGRARWPGAESDDPPDMAPWQVEEEDAAMRRVLRQNLPYVTNNLEKLMARIDLQHRKIRANIIVVLHELLEMRSQLASGSSINLELMNRLLAQLSDSVKAEDLVHGQLHRVQDIAERGPGGESEDQTD